MIIKLSPDTFFVFDLDDTLYYEADYLRSAYRSIAHKLLPYTDGDIYDWMLQHYNNKQNVFAAIVDKYADSMPASITLQHLLAHYREHMPAITLADTTRTFLLLLKAKGIPMGIITDGRSITQRNKLKALEIESYFQDIIISEEFGSEKPDARNYRYYHDKYPNSDFYFVGDNTTKDFIVPAQLGWQTICLRNAGHNIHEQDTERLPSGTHLISSFDEIELT